jgi:hypothetical protein
MQSYKFPDASGYEFVRWIHVLSAFLLFFLFFLLLDLRTKQNLITVSLSISSFSNSLEIKSVVEQRLWILKRSHVAGLPFAKKKPGRIDSFSTRLAVSPDCDLRCAVIPHAIFSPPGRPVVE